MLPPTSAGVVSASFLASVGVGLASIPVAHRSHVPPVIFSIPSVIPMVPGAFAYKAMLGLMKLTGTVEADYAKNLGDTVHNGALTLFIVLAISLGVAVPMHVFRRKTAKNLWQRRVK
jgi:uncharacterized membrane protein YjjB (DUF3815 family)